MFHESVKTWNGTEFRKEACTFFHGINFGNIFRFRSVLRAIDSKYGESNDSSENSVFLLLHQNDPFGELFSEI